MRRLGILSLAVLVGLQAVAAPASAVQVPLLGFEGDLAAVAFEDESLEEGDRRITVLTGELDVDGDTYGLFFASGTTLATATDVTRVEVYDTTGNLSAIDLDQLNATGRPIHAAFTNATLSFSYNATFVYYTNGSIQAVAASSPFAFAVPLLPPERLAGTTLGTLNITLNTTTSLAMVGDTILDAALAAVTSDSFLYASGPDVSIRIVDEANPEGQTFVGTQYLVRLMDNARLHVEAPTLLVPMGSGMAARFQPAPEHILTAEFDIGQITESLARVTGDNRSSQLRLDDNAVAIFQSLAPTLNGVVFGNPEGSMALEGNDRLLGAFTLLRFAALTVKSGQADGDVHYEGQGRFLLAGEELYSKQGVVGPSVFPIPALGIVLWLLAAAALVLGFVLKPFFASQPAGNRMPLRMAGLAFRIFATILVFVLWDFEVRAFLGTSILHTLFGGGSTEGAAFGIVAGAQLLTFSLAYLFLGLPVRFIVNSVLRLANLKRARGVGKGIAHLAAWGLGAAFIPAFLNPIVSLLSDQLGKGL